MELSQIKPVYDRIVIRKIEQPDKSKGGIFFPDTSKSPSQIGEVIAVGPGRNIDAPGGYRVLQPAGSYADKERYEVKVLRPEMQCKVGDFVIFGKYAGADVKIGNEEIFLLREDEILAILADYTPPAVEADDEKVAEPDPEPAEPSLIVVPE